MRTSLILIVLFAVSACTCRTGRQRVGHEETPRSAQVGQRHGREFTVVWGNSGRGGAAMRLPAYTHVLAPAAPTRAVARPRPLSSHDTTPQGLSPVFVEAEPIMLFSTEPDAECSSDRSIYSKDHKRIARKRQKP
ncbi:MAG: hypothetical protein V6Z86_09330 [Hyphomicrobiales bacterium]